MAELPPTAETDGLAHALSRVALGDRQAFEAVYRQAAGRLFAICLRVLSDRAEAEDVLQDVFTTVWHKAGQFDASRASAATWLAQIARNRAIDRLRAAPAAGHHAPIEFADDVADGEPSPAHAAERDDDNARLGECLAKLDGRRRTLIRTAFFEVGSPGTELEFAL